MASALTMADLTPDQMTLVAVLVALSTIYLCVRTWKKTSGVNAKLQPYGSDVVLPPHVKSYVPFLGSALEMGKGIRKFIARYSAKFNQPIFTATIAGDHCLFIGDPDHVTMVYRYARYLDEYALQKQFTRNVLGLTEEKDEKETFSSKEAAKQYHHYLFTDGELTKTICAAQDVFFEHILPNLVKGDSSTGWQKHGLFAIVKEAVFKASIGPLISKHMATDDASELFTLFDKGIPLMFSGAPSFLIKDALSARDMLVEMISDAKFIDEGSDLILARSKIGLSDNVFIRAGLGLLFASVGNSIPAVFWSLNHIIADPTVYQAIQAEVDAIAKLRKKENDPFTLQELDQMVLLKSAFMEALRLYHGAFATREATESFVFDPKKPGQSKYLIEKGTRVMAFPATMHHDPEVFPDPETFRFDRFAPTMDESGELRAPVFTKNGKKVPEPLRAFGGGAHLCTGRKFIAYEAQAFVALLLTQFEMKLVDGEEAPSIDYSMQGVGVSHPDKNTTVEIRLRTGAI